MSNAFRRNCFAMVRCLLDRASERISWAAGLGQLARRPAGLIQVGPDALVHLGHANSHGDKSNAKFVFHGRAQEYTINLDRPGLSQWHGSVAGRGLDLGRNDLVKVAPYVHDESLYRQGSVAAHSLGSLFVRISGDS
jgi:hypothetical protein